MAHCSSRAIPAAWSCWDRSICNNVRMPRAGVGRGVVELPHPQGWARGWGEHCFSSWASQAFQCSGVAFHGTLQVGLGQGGNGGTHRSVLAVQIVPCSRQRLFLVSQQPWLLPVPWLGTPPGQVSSEPPPTAAPSLCPLLCLSRKPLEGAHGLKGCCFLGSCPELLPRILFCIKFNNLV